MPEKKDTKREVGVSFLPESESRDIFGRSSRAALLVGVLAAVLVITGISAFYLRFAAAKLSAQVSDLELKTARVKAGISEDEARFEALGNVGQLIGLSRSALAKHRGGEGALLLLERSTIPEATITQIAADSAGTVILSVKARDFGAVTRQLLVWQGRSEIISSKITGLTGAFDKLGVLQGVEFNATLQVLPELFMFAAYAGQQ